MQNVWLPTMSMLSNTIDIEIQHPGEWKLSLRIDEKCVRFTAHSDVELNSLVSQKVELSGGEGDFLRSLENSIYDNPFFLLDFKRVSIALHSMRHIVLPDEFADNQELAERAFSAMYGTIDGDVIVDRLNGCGAAIAFEAPHGVLAFLNRTFNNPPVRHHLSALCEYFAAKNDHADVDRQYMYLHDGLADVLVFKEGRFVLANTFECRTADDTAFFALDIWNMQELDAFNDELQIAGDKSVREAVTPILKKYITYVMPVIFPAAAMKIGQDSMKAPFDLILMSLCE